VRKTSRREVETEEAWGMMGCALTLLHEIERDLAQAIFVGLTPKQKKKYPTVNALQEARAKMTFGQLVGIMKEQWHLTGEFDEFINNFVEERNHLVHDLTELPGFGVARKRDRVRLAQRVGRFVQMAFIARRVFRGANFASVDFMRHWVKTQKGVDVPIELSAEAEDRIEDFFSILGDQRDAQK
jgi:hypothetical protein